MTSRRASQLPRRIALVAFYAVLACAVLWPYRGRAFRGAGDLTGFIAGTVEARNALREGQFPIRVAPHQLDGARYPLFQYYANLPYTITGLLCRAGLDPYTSWKLAMLAAFTLGGIFVHLSAYRLTRSRTASLVAGTAFVLAPYVFTDLNARGAIAELFAMNFLGVAFYATLRCLMSRRWRYVVACALAWTAVGLSHNITYLFGVILLGPFFLSLIRVRRRRGAGVGGGRARADACRGAVAGPVAAQAAGRVHPGRRHVRCRQRHDARRRAGLRGGSERSAGADGPKRVFRQHGSLLRVRLLRADRGRAEAEGTEDVMRGMREEHVMRDA